MYYPHHACAGLPAPCAGPTPLRRVRPAPCALGGGDSTRNCRLPWAAEPAIRKLLAPGSWLLEGTRQGNAIPPAGEIRGTSRRPWALDLGLGEERGWSSPMPKAQCPMPARDAAKSRDFSRAWYKLPYTLNRSANNSQAKATNPQAKPARFRRFCHTFKALHESAPKKHFSLEGPRPAEPETLLARKTPRNNRYKSERKCNEAGTKWKESGKKVERNRKESGKKPAIFKDLAEWGMRVLLPGAALSRMKDEGGRMKDEGRTDDVGWCAAPRYCDPAFSRVCRSKAPSTVVCEGARSHLADFAVAWASCPCPRAGRPCHRGHP